MSKIIKKLEEARKKGLNDDLVLVEVEKIIPEKKDVFDEAKKRGATSTQILEKIIADNVNSEAKQSHGIPASAGMTGEDAGMTGEDAGMTKEKEITSSLPVVAPRNDEKIKQKEDIKSKIKKKKASLTGSRFFKDFFAATRYLLIGVDISDYSIEVLLLDRDGSVASYGRSIIEEGVVYNGEILNQKKLSDVLKQTLENTKPNPLEIPEHTKKDQKNAFGGKEHKAIVSLPESKVYTQIFKFKDKQNLYNKIKEHIVKAMPFDNENFYWDFIELPCKEGAKVLCIATLQDFADAYIHFFKSTNIDPVAFEIEGGSIGRALLPIKKIKTGKKKKNVKEVMADSKSRMVIDMGARNTVINIFNEDADLVVSVPLPYAGNYFTKKVSDKLNISTKEAEKIKQQDGFKQDGQTHEILKEHTQKIVKEIAESRRYYKNEFDGEIKEILLAGGTCLLPGMTEFLQKEVDDITVKIGDPLRKINDLGMFNEKDAVLYANVIGLGLRSLKDDPINNGINLLPEEVKNQAKKSQQEQHRSVLLVAVFIVIAGFLLLGLAVYYLIYLPVPAPMQPLKDRVLLVLEDTEIEAIDVVYINIDLEEDGAIVYSGPGDETDIISQVEAGSVHKATGQRGIWMRISIEEENIEGWIHGENLEAVKTMSIEEFNNLKTKESIDTEELEETEEDEEELEEEIDND